MAPVPYTEAASIDRQRYRTITGFFARIILHLVWWDIVLRRLLPGRALESRARRWRRLARRFRLLAIDMGGVLIKLGQFLSARVDVLPPEITEELQGLQDEVPPVATESILAVLQAELGDIEQRFAELERRPLAAASLGQVHRAWLHSRNGGARGVPVVVKVQRPGIETVVRTDLAALRVVARWMMRYRPIRRRADMPALMEEFAETLWEELDYEREAANAERFAEMFVANPGVYIPHVFRRHSTRKVLVLENVEAIKILDREGIDAAGIDRSEVAVRLLDTYFQQIFEEGFFHADPHPGNLFVQPGEAVADGPRPFTLIFVDFGMVGHIESLMGDQLRRLLVAVTQRDAHALTLAYRDLGFFLPHADLERITEAQATLLEQLWGRNLMELAQPDPEEVQALSAEFRDILFAFPFQVPQDFIYLGRAMGMLSGLSSLLDPEINPWYHIERFGRELLRGDAGMRAGWAVVRELVQPLLELPVQFQRVLTAAEQGRLRIHTAPDKATQARLERLERHLLRLQATTAASAGLLAALLLYLRRRD